MRRWNFYLLIIILFLIVDRESYHLKSTSAQGGSICVLAFEDNNRNGLRDEGEEPMAGVNVNLAVNADIIIRTHITTDDGVYCFDNLESGLYNLYFEKSPNHVDTTENSTPVTLNVSERPLFEFGAISAPALRDVSAEEPVQVTATDNRLSTTNRLLLAALGAIVVMVFMFGFGVILVSFMR